MRNSPSDAPRATFPRAARPAMLAPHKRPFTPPLRRAFRDEHRHFRTPRFRRLRPGRPLPARQRPSLSHRHPGPGAPADDAAPARPRRGAQHRRFHLRLSRLTARHVRQRAVDGEAVPEGKQHPLPARPQRGPRRHLGVGHAAGQSVSRRDRRWRVLDLVRQGPRRRPLDGRAEARQCGRHLAAWRRDRAGRRRPWLPVLDLAASERAGLRRGDDPGSEPGQRPGISRLRHSRLRAVALLGLLDRLQGDLRDRRIRRLGVGRSRAHQDRDADRFPAAAGRARHPQSRPAARGGKAPAWAEDASGQGVRARQRFRQDGDRSAAGAHRHHDAPARPISTRARRWRISASTRRAPAPSASASTRSA